MSRGAHQTLGGDVGRSVIGAGRLIDTVGDMPLIGDVCVFAMSVLGGAFDTIDERWTTESFDRPSAQTPMILVVTRARTPVRVTRDAQTTCRYDLTA